VTFALLLASVQETKPGVPEMSFGKTMIKALKTFDINNPKGGGANNYTSTVWIRQSQLFVVALGMRCHRGERPRRRRAKTGGTTRLKRIFNDKDAYYKLDIRATLSTLTKVPEDVVELGRKITVLSSRSPYTSFRSFSRPAGSLP